jgi:hypothetical protein
MRLFVLIEPMCSIRTKPSLVTTSGISRKMSAIVIVRRWWVEHEPPVKLRTALGGVGINWTQIEELRRGRFRYGFRRRHLGSGRLGNDLRRLDSGVFDLRLRSFLHHRFRFRSGFLHRLHLNGALLS